MQLALLNKARQMEHHHHHNHEVEAHHMHGHQPKEVTQPQKQLHAHHDTNGRSHDKHAGHHTEDFLKRFWISVVLTIPVLLLSQMIQHWFGFHISFAGHNYVLLAFSAMIYFYGGWPFLIGMINEIRYRSIGMMSLIAIAITVAFLYSVATTLGLEGMDFFWELATLIDIMLLGHWLEMRSQMAASRALESLVALLPSIVHIERNGQVMDISLKDLHNDEIIIIKPGEKLPADGIVLDGRSYVNESMLTGESLPVEKIQGAAVIGGSVNTDGVLRIQVTGTGKDSYLSKVVNLVESAQTAKSRTQNLADTVARWLTFISLAVGIGSFVYWFGKEDNWAFALEKMVTVMVTSCPHALGVAIPLVAAISTARSATNGLLIRNRTAFENSRRITTVIFDKTGTLTKGSHEVQRIISLSNEYSENEVLQYAAAVQQHSEHHIAHGVLKALRGKNFELWKSNGFDYMKGVGVSARVNNKLVTVAGPNYFKERRQAIPEIPGILNRAIETITFVLIDGRPIGAITLADSIRETSHEAIQQLRRLNIKSFLLTGDNEKVAAAVSEKLSMDGYLANILPDEKQAQVKKFQDRGEIVAMIGDGVNDAPALAQADVGIAIGSGTDVAAETADIILVNSDPRDVVRAISFGRSTYRKMLQNLAWAVGYNVLAIPLAAGVLYPHFTLTPAAGAVLMSLSTIIVAINARLLRLK